MKKSYFTVYIKNGKNKWESAGKIKIYSLSDLDHGYGLELTKQAGYFGYGIRWVNTNKIIPIYEFVNNSWIKYEENLKDS